ncbi:MAG: tyrosine-type recombinase/integrase, partial [Methanohalobium sp.]|uniref:tyrosine-type recombinase/integrase n=1 Tax=Methanohalobium sp. TaxID=2837493 RepID=UPI00397A6E7A
MVFNDFERQLKNVENCIQKANYPDENKQVLFDFENHMFMDGFRTSSIKTTIFNLHNISKHINKPFSEIQKRDIESYIGYLERNVDSESRKKLMKTYLKKFFRWYNGGTEPEKTSWINTNSKKSGTKKLPDQLMTTDEVKAMIDAAYYIRDKALIAVLYDSGARISEIGNLQIKDVTFDQYGAVLRVNGKTGMRRIRIIFSVPYISNWLDNHPFKDKKDSYIWVTLSRRSKGEQLKYPTIYLNLKKIASRAGIEKRIYNHLFRHSRATEL